MFREITDQILQVCNCPEVKERDLKELITLISQMTCWGDGTDSFLLSDREEIIEITPEAIKDGIYQYEPYYKVFDKETMQIELVKVSGIEEQVSDGVVYNYSDMVGAYLIKLPRELHKPHRPKDPCREPKPHKPCKWYLHTMYEAGYERIPEHMITLFCDMLALINRKNDCSCSDGCNCSSSSGSLEEPSASIYKEGDWLGWEHDKDMAELLNKQYVGILEDMTLCKNEDDEIWVVKSRKSDLKGRQ